MPERTLALVTGASSGIGYELAREFADHGFSVVAVAEEPEIETAARQLSDRVRPLRLDLTQPDAVEELVNRTAEIGPVSALAINAGTGVGGAFVHQTELADQLATVDLNVRSAVHLAKRVLPGMIDRGHGRVLFTSSIAATAPGPYQAVYNASKAFLQSFAQALRAELKGTGVTVTALMPGPTETRFFARAGMLDTRVGAGPKDSAAQVAKQGFAAMMDGKDHVIAGALRNRVQAVAGRVLPDPLLAAIHRKMSAPGSAHR